MPVKTKRKPAIKKEPVQPQVIYVSPQGSTSPAGAFGKFGSELAASVTTGKPWQRMLNTLLWIMLGLVIAVIIVAYSNRDFVGKYFESITRESEVRIATIKTEQDRAKRIENLVANVDQISALGRSVDSALRDNILELRSSCLMVVHFHDQEPTSKEFLNATVRNYQPSECVDDYYKRFRSQSLSHFDELIQKLNQDQCWIVPRLLPTVPQHKFWSDRGAKSVIACPIRGLRREVSGFLVAEYRSPFEEAAGLSLETALRQFAAPLGGSVSSQQTILDNR